MKYKGGFKCDIFVNSLYLILLSTFTIAVTVLAFYVAWSRALARASIGGVGRQNSVFIYKPNLVNNFFFL